MKKNLLLLFAALLMMKIAKAQEITVSPTSLTGFSYVENEGPSEERTFFVSAFNLIGLFNITDTIQISASEHFKISAQSGDDFEETILLYTDETGAVEETPIYVRMIEGLPVGQYSDVIRISSQREFFQDVIVACWGVVIMPTLRKPSLSLEGNTYSGVQELEITCEDVGASILYRTSLLEDWQDYTSPIYIDRDMSICAKAIKEGYYDSEEVCGEYIIEYFITVLSNDENQGSVTPVHNPYHYGEPVILEAIVTDSTEFICWNDEDSTNPRQITVTSDSTFTAVFGRKSFSIELLADPYEGGSMSMEGNPYYGSTCTITADADEDAGFTFVNWTEGDIVISDSKQYSFVVKDNHTFKAHFTRLPRVGDIETPESVCDGVALDITVPETVNANGGEWQMSQDENFDSIIPYYIGQTLDQSFNGWWLRYEAKNVYGSSYSNKVVISIHSLIDASSLNNISYSKEYGLVYSDPLEGFKYQWYKDGNRIEGANQQYYFPDVSSGSGTYKVYISFTGEVKCGAFSSEIVINGSIESSSSLSFYPNPSHVGEAIVIANDDNEESILTIYSLDGRLLHSQNVIGKQVSLSVILPQGIYVACLTNKEGSKTEKIVIQ